MTIRRPSARCLRLRLAPTCHRLPAEADGAFRVKTRWLLAAWAALSAVSAVGTAMTPALLGVPLLLMLLTPRLPALVLAASVTPAPIFFTFASIRMMVADPIHFELGRRYGARFVPARVNQLMSRFGPVVVALRPHSHYLAAAGASGIPAPVALGADLAGTLVLLAAVYGGTSAMLG